MSETTIQDNINKWLQEYGRENFSVADSLCDRHAHIREKIALYYENEAGESKKYTFAELKDLSSKMAGFLQGIGVEKGDRIAVMLPKSPEIIISALAIWRLGAVYQPLFTAFGPEAIAYRMKDSNAKVIITDTTNRIKLNEITDKSDIKVVTVSDLNSKTKKNDYDFLEILNNSIALEKSITVSGEDIFVLLYTSGTTGNPKGAKIPVKSLASFESYMKFGLDLRENDVYWSVADPGWAYGLYYNLIGPLLIGQAVLFYHAPFKPENVYKILDKYEVTNFAASPTAYRVMVAAGAEELKNSKIKLRVASSAGEPLNPSLVAWAKENLGIAINDHYGQTELGMAVNNHHLPELRKPIKPGSMGQNAPGLRIVVLDKEANEVGPGQEGEMAVDTHNSPLFWFQGYWQDEERTKQRFMADGRYYLAGDAVSMDEDGYVFFSGRSDDVIMSAGYRIGPFEVESALMQHPSVAEAAVIGVPDELKGEIVKAFVVLKTGYTPSEELSTELGLFVRNRLSAHQYPKLTNFVNELPKTPSGKVQRYLLRDISR